MTYREQLNKAMEMGLNIVDLLIPQKSLSSYANM